MNLIKKYILIVYIIHNCYWGDICRAKIKCEFSHRKVLKSFIISGLNCVFKDIPNQHETAKKQRQSIHESAILVFILSLENAVKSTRSQSGHSKPYECNHRKRLFSTSFVHILSEYHSYHFHLIEDGNCVNVASLFIGIIRYSVNWISKSNIRNITPVNNEVFDYKEKDSALFQRAVEFKIWWEWSFHSATKWFFLITLDLFIQIQSNR